jgi:beta-lactam-binding protein with PASTA domain
MVSPDGSVRITDFGIAKSHLSTAVTQAGIAFGTADYISPEQAQGLPASPRSDIYSLGVVVYEMLTRHLPFTGDSPMAVAVQHIQQAPPPLRQWVPALPASLERIVLTALAKNPRDRPASARAFASALNEYRLAQAQQTMAVPVVPRSAHSRQGPPARATANPRQQSTAPLPVSRPPAQQPARPRRPLPAAVPPPLAQPRRDRGGGVGGGLLIGLLLLVGLLGLAYVVFATDLVDQLFAASPTAVVPANPSPTAAPTTTSAPQITVPNFVGRSELDVVNQLAQLGLRRGVIGPAQFNPAPAGTVIDQDPKADVQVAAGSEVKILVSLGPPTPTPAPATPTSAPPTPTLPPTVQPTAATLPVPSLVGQSFDVVEPGLKQAGIAVVRQDTPSTTVPAGIIMRQTPPAGPLQPGATVTLLVSRGDVVAFPNVITLDRTEAERIIRSTAGLNLQLVDEQGPDRLPNFSQFRPNEVVSAQANGRPVDNGAFVPRGANIILGVRKP